MADRLDTTPQTITHVLNRLSFGPRPGDRDRVQSMGITAYIEEQLTPQTITEPDPLTRRLQALETQRLSAIALFKRHQQIGDGNSSTMMSEAEEPADRQMARNASPKNQQQAWRQQIVTEAVQARLLRAIDSPRQLQEVMVDFWFNHFNVFAYQNGVSLWLGSYERDAIRPHALGRFRTLLGATAKHPAMLKYLDNWRNTDPSSAGATGVYQGFNENYAREVMELHTMGVEGGYSQADVEALTRMLTGWSVIETSQLSVSGDRSGDRNPDSNNGFFFAQDRHDSSSKQFLSTTITGGGIEEGETALDMLAVHPSTARFISFKLAQYFVSDDPPPSLVGDLASEFETTRGDIAAVLTVLFHHPQFWDAANEAQKLKTPYQYALSLGRAVGLTQPNDSSLRAIESGINTLGMPLYQVRSPDGYANTQATWLSPDTLLRRIDVAQRIAKTHRELIGEAADLMATVHHNFLPQTQTAIQSTPQHLQSVLVLGSPEMMYR